VTPYYSDGDVTLHLGDMREVLPDLQLAADAIVTDPPYAETELAWDRWPDGWPAVAASASSSMWCFGSLRMFLERRDEFARWKLSQDVVWEKTCGTSIAADRFSRTHETAAHWYSGDWSATHHAAQRERHYGPDKGTKRNPGDRMAHRGARQRIEVNQDDGRRLVRSVFKVPNMRGRAIHPTEKPVGVLDPLIRYACPPGGTVLDPFAGSGSTAAAARMSGRKAVLVEKQERYCEAIARRLSQDVLPLAELHSRAVLDG
jgi:site-specific DNA-methyltransferase (adenine-specific)